MRNQSRIPVSYLRETLLCIYKFILYVFMYMNSLVDLGFVVSVERLDILGQLGRTPNFMIQPPKEHLVEKASVCFIQVIEKNECSYGFCL